MAEYYFSSRAMTFLVRTDENDVIVWTPAIAAKLRGQPLDNLRRWMRKQGGFKEHRYD
jgi:hypothetical protein